MRLFWRKVVLASVLAVGFGGSGYASAAGLPFADVASNHWGYSSIQWAYDHHIAGGYPDGTFKPDQPVTQKEFLALLIRTFQPNDFSYEGDEIDWGIPFINYAAKMGWSGAIITPPPGPVTASQSDIKETRMHVAKLITNASGRNYSFDDSIQFMLDTHLSSGKTAKTVDGFGKNDKLTRAEAAAFMMNLKSKLDILYASPFTEQQYDPATANLSPAESMVLEVQRPQGDGMIKFSDVTFAPLQVGYKKISSSDYTISGTALNGIGNSLTIKVARKQANGFVEDHTYDVTIKEGRDFEQAVHFAEKGLYRITVEAPADIHHKVETAKICMFYLEYMG